MPFVIPFILGAAAGGGTLWFVSDVGDKLTKAALLAGGAYVAYKVLSK